MSYDLYCNIINEHKKSLSRPGKLETVMDAYISPRDFEAVITISKTCDLSALASACLWAIERSIAARPSMRIRFDERIHIAKCWAMLSDKTGHENNINKNRFKRWTHLTDDWEQFYQHTQEFLRLCKIDEINFSRRSLFEAIKQRDITQKRYEDGTYLQMEKTEFFNVAMMMEFLDSSKL
ncbi:hypothetical protein GUQ16_001943 [Salmonella enterica]|nr:hypothetical protein [Salmonella enterica subsp. enterica serovar Fufu]EDN6947475.1 hypothetical protein [Salmonella enterica]